MHCCRLGLFVNTEFQGRAVLQHGEQLMFAEIKCGGLEVVKEILLEEGKVLLRGGSLGGRTGW